MLDKLKVLLGVTDKDDILTILIDMCSQDAITYCHLDSIETTMQPVIIQMAMEKFNKLGSDGISSRGFSGVSESYTDDYSNAIYEQLKRFRKIITI